MKDKSSSTGFLGWLTLLFIGLKLTGYISWSWWWVLSPLWGPVVVVLGLCVVYLFAYIVLEIIRVIVRGLKRRLRG